MSEEQIIRDVLGMWAEGLESTKRSWELHAVDDLVWWNSARGGLTGLRACLSGIDQMFDLLGVGYVEVPIRHLHAEPGRVFVERSDNLLRPDGSVIADIPVTGVIDFAGERIAAWRDYCDDWMTKLSRGETTPPTAP